MAPGLYAVGDAGVDSPVFVTANYTLSFDALRSALAGRDGYILVLDTEGINVWCAAGKGTFGTEELVGRIEETALGNVVRHRRLLLPQLGAPGVSVHEVWRRSGFQVEYGPVRAADLPEYLKAGGATPEMRRVKFGLWDRAVLIPVELAHVVLPTVVAAVGLFFVGGRLASAGVVAAVMAGVVFFPVVLPWVPTRDFSSKGLILGGVVAAPVGLAALAGGGGGMWVRWASAAAYVFAMTPVTAFLALNFTGSTPFTSRSGVRREIFRYIPIMGGMLGLGVVLMIVLAVAGVVGGVR